ncbi:MAG: hypothetical protein JWO67_6493 [Streptosporangiaceae bacterium]|nr:hypothetical protein [Streptosporangiaceae bacterium]
MSEFELDKGGTRLTVEEHSDGEFYLGCEEPISEHTFDSDGTGHGCVSGMWLTRAEAVELRDWLSTELAGETPDMPADHMRDAADKLEART